MLHTGSHASDTARVPIGDVLIKCCSQIEHCENERDWERVGIHFKQFIFDDEDFFRLKKKEKEE